MSKTITHDGVEYIEKTHVDEIVRQRISRYTEKLSTAETQIAQYQAQLDEASAKLGLFDNLSTQVETLQGELKTANSRYERHAVISQYGITDNGIRDAVEWAYDKAMQSADPTQQLDLSSWMEQIHSNPDLAPSILRPFITAPTAPTTPQQPQPTLTPTAQPIVQAVAPTAPVVAPSSNAGVAVTGSAPVPSDVLQRATDPAFYAENREAIREAYYRQAGQSTSPYKF